MLAICPYYESSDKSLTSAYRVGPGYWPLTNMQFWRVTPSGAQVVLVTSQLYFLVTPVLGFLVSKSVAMLKPLPQQALVNGEFVQAGSATKLERAEVELELKVVVVPTEVDVPEVVVETFEDDDPTDDDFKVDELEDLEVPDDVFDEVLEAFDEVLEAFDEVLVLLLETVCRLTRPSRSLI